MKIILLLFAFTLQIIAQERYQETDFYVKDKAIEWSHVYESSLIQNDLLIEFQKSVTSTFIVENFVLIDNIISFTVSDDSIDREKYGLSSWKSAMYALFPLYYFVRIDFRDYKYKVTVSKIEAICPYPRNVFPYNIYLKKNNTEIHDAKVDRTSFNSVHRFFLEKFTIKEKTEEKW